MSYGKALEGRVRDAATTPQSVYSLWVGVRRFLYHQSPIRFYTVVAHRLCLLLCVQVSADGDLVVALNTVQDDALRGMGIARQVVNKVQKLRKHAGLQVRAARTRE